MHPFFAKIINKFMNAVNGDKPIQQPAVRSKWSAPDLEAVFNKSAAEMHALMREYQPQGMRGHSLGADEADEPSFCLIFDKNAKPDLSKLPKKIGEMNIRYEFRGPARLI